MLERHGINGNIGRGFVRGFGPLRGAIASTIGHDSHNITVLGSDDGDMATAVNHLIAIQGGAVVVRGGEVLADLPLPVAGLMSDRGFGFVRERLVILRAAAARDRLRARGAVPPARLPAAARHPPPEADGPRLRRGGAGGAAPVGVVGLAGLGVGGRAGLGAARRTTIPDRSGRKVTVSAPASDPRLRPPPAPVDFVGRAAKTGFRNGPVGVKSPE